ncbi:hypothetical protein KC19_7G030600 [Ceratodon purpureus]|uniref:Secreted protein n=1 Tax=Ceratodon purpureus TaxID=3225 RepID=A0A8T0HA62_CERPU|nr:hypothetical protein KC19_7G030600 [Ceratodon purpureus]
MCCRLLKRIIIHGMWSFRFSFSSWIAWAFPGCGGHLPVGEVWYESELHNESMLLCSSACCDDSRSVGWVGGG